MKTIFLKWLPLMVILPTVLILSITISAQEGKRSQAKTTEGDLDKSIDTESKDLMTKLEAVEQEQYVTQQYLFMQLFQQQYAGRITMKRVLYPNVDRELTPGFVFAPTNLDKNKRYPGLIVVHGGYHGSFEPNFFGLIEAAVTNGYIVIFPEYRGSRGYGAAQYKAIDFGGKEVDDVVSAADYLVKSLSFVDGSRLGIYGRSKGGMIILLAIERFPEKFKAAVDVVGLTDLVAYTAYKPAFRSDDLAAQPRFGGKKPSENLAAYMDVSPINHVDDIKTPLLIHSTTGDKTAPVELHAGRLIDVLKARGKIFEFKIYDRAPGGHLFNHGDSDEAADSEKRIFEFLGKYLKP